MTRRPCPSGRGSSPPAEPIINVNLAPEYSIPSVATSRFQSTFILEIEGLEIQIITEVWIFLLDTIITNQTRENNAQPIIVVQRMFSLTL